MPTKFRLQLDAQLKLDISGQTAAVRSKRQSNEWCPYPQFVENLGKEMATPGEEAHHHTTGMSGEAGELLDITKKTWIYGKPLDIPHIIEEMGDLRWYYQSMLNMLGLTDEDIQAANTVKLMKRYPNGVYSNQAAIARADKAPGEDKERHVPTLRKFFGMPTPGTDCQPDYLALKLEERGSLTFGQEQELRRLHEEKRHLLVEETRRLNATACDEHLVSELDKFQGDLSK